MKALLIPVVLLSAAVPVVAQPVVADLDGAVRCAALFGNVAGSQQRGEASATRFPPLAQRGREFFVQVGARLIDERKLSRSGAEQVLRAELAKLRAEISAAPDPAVATGALMAPCLTLLDATIPPAAGRTP